MLPRSIMSKLPVWSISTLSNESSGSPSTAYRKNIASTDAIFVDCDWFGLGCNNIELRVACRAAHGAS